MTGPAKIPFRLAWLALVSADAGAKAVAAQGTESGEEGRESDLASAVGSEEGWVSIFPAKPNNNGFRGK